jgi:uncharacterized membrane protein YfcA
MSPTELALIGACLLLGAALYTSVGHAGASAYIAILGAFGFSAATIKPTALVLNILIASLVTWRFARSGLIDRRLLLTLAVPAIPLAFLGGYVQLSDESFKRLVGAILLVAAVRFIFPPRDRPELEASGFPVPGALLAGASIGMLSGLTGTGGGIFLSPLVLFFGWTATKKASGTAAAFILMNSTAGLLGNFTAIRNVPPELPIFAVCAFAGALVGTTLGIRHFNNPQVRKALGVVLVVAGTKFVLGL